MGSEHFNSIKQKTVDYLARVRGATRISMPAALILLITLMAILGFELFGAVSNDEPLSTPIAVNRDAQSEGLAQKGSVFDQSNADIFTNSNLKQIINSVKKVPFKAKIITDTGHKGYWTQSGDNYRLEDPAKQNIIIYNAETKKLWIIDVPGKTASETLLTIDSADSYSTITPALLIGGLSVTTTTAETKTIENIIPVGTRSWLTSTKQGLPDRWEGIRSDGSKCFVDWEYLRFGNISPDHFTLPKGISVVTTSSATPSTTGKK